MKQEIDAAKAEAGALDSGNALSPADFLARVTAAGGRADFVFGKDRPFAQCHASTVVETADGGLLCAFVRDGGECRPTLLQQEEIRELLRPDSVLVARQEDAT